jgi:hypothetical protein
MIKIKLKISGEQFTDGAADYQPDSDFNQDILSKGQDKEIEDHGLSPEQAKEIAKDELVLEPEKYSKEVKNRKLSTYWKKRARRRALNAKRTWPNSKDRKWALSEQDKSLKMNEMVKDLFENEFEITEDLSNTIKEFIKNMKKQKSKFQKTTPEDLRNRAKPSKPAKQRKNQKNKIAGRVKETPNSVGPMGSFGPF